MEPFGARDLGAAIWRMYVDTDQPYGRLSYSLRSEE